VTTRPDPELDGFLALLATRRTQPWRAGAVLTDDYAPYDLLMGDETKESRADVVN